MEPHIGGTINGIMEFDENYLNGIIFLIEEANHNEITKVIENTKDIIIRKERDLIQVADWQKMIIIMDNYLIENHRIDNEFRLTNLIKNLREKYSF